MSKTYQGDPMISTEQREMFCEWYRILSDLQEEYRDKPDKPHKYQSDGRGYFLESPFVAEILKSPSSVLVNFFIFNIEITRGLPSLFEKLNVRTYYGVQRYIPHKLVSQTLPMSENEAMRMVRAMFDDNGLKQQYCLYSYPTQRLLSQIKKQFSQKNLSDEFKACLQSAHDTYHLFSKGWLTKPEAITRAIFIEIINGNKTEAYIPNDDMFADYANDLLNQLPERENQIWVNILKLAAKAPSGTHTNEKFDTAMLSYLDELGHESFQTMMIKWLEYLMQTQKEEVTYPVCRANQDLVKGLLFACKLLQLSNKPIVNTLIEFTEYSYAKIYNVGPRYMLWGHVAGSGVSRLSDSNPAEHFVYLQTRVKSKQGLKNIQERLRFYASREGISVQELIDRVTSNQDFGLVNNAREWKMKDYTCRLQIKGVGKSEILWFKPDGSPQKTAPSFVKEEFASTLKEIKSLKKKLDTTLITQRNRVDFKLRSEHRISVEQAKQSYWEHSLISLITNSLIFQFYQDDTDLTGVAALRLNGIWVNELGEELDISSYQQVNFWHPVLASIDSVKNWRNLLIKNEISQTIKQAFREIYVLTDAERNTRTYSNRFAAHILKQHQYMALAKERSWRGELAGLWDDGDNSSVSQVSSEYRLTAHFVTQPIEEPTENRVFLYVTTDKIYFTRNSVELELSEVPVRIFSEVLRDVDLFVGVASVGNDPTWQDNGGEPRYQQYWQAYSFGDLNEMAKTRKSVLEMLLPRLKIGKVAHIDGNFLVVQGKLRTYKIHIGSTNILMLPNDQYLCIVPDRSKKDVTSQLFIPFEGDAALSVVLSKAMLLADDDKITDSTIVSQIGRK